MNLRIRYRPSIGVIPREIHEYKRIKALKEAIYRYLSEGVQIPDEWVAEYNELLPRRAQYNAKE